MDKSTIIYDEVIESCDEEIKTIPTNFKEKSITFKIQSFYILLIFLLTNIAFLIAVSIYCYHIKYYAKKSIYYLFHSTKLKQIYNDNIN